jgi:hypothetical protein
MVFSDPAFWRAGAISTIVAIRKQRRISYVSDGLTIYFGCAAESQKAQDRYYGCSDGF